MNLWEGRWLILGCCILFLALGGFYAWHKVPIYQVDALLQVEAKKDRPSDPAFAKMEGLFAETADAQAEIELLKSNLILGRTVAALNLDTVARPVYLPVVGAALSAPDPAAPAVAVQTFDVPPALRGLHFRLTALGDGRFAWTDQDGQILGSGRPGDMVKASLAGSTLLLQVQSLSGKPGQRFDLLRKPERIAIEDLRKDFSAEERGKMTNVIGLTYRCPSRIAGHRRAQRDRQPVFEIQGGEARRRHRPDPGGPAGQDARAQGQAGRVGEPPERVPGPDRLGGPEQGSGRGGDARAPRSAATSPPCGRNGRICCGPTSPGPTWSPPSTTRSAACSRRGTSWKPGPQPARHPADGGAAVPGRGGQPGTLYLLLNNIQELQLAKAGGQEGFQLVDPATPSMEPIGPKPAMQVAMFGFLGLLAGGARPGSSACCAGASRTTA